MAEHSNIEWTDATWNPIVGCSIKSPGCRLCYAMKDAWRKHHNPKLPHYHGLTKKVNGHAVWTGILRQAPEHILTAPLHWRRPRMIFVNSMGDLFHEDVPDEWIDKVFAVMGQAQQHTFQVLTKRADRMRAWAEKATVRHQLCGGDGCNYCGDHDGRVPWKSYPFPNVWLGVSAERQKEADERLPYLINTPAAVRFLSAEPLIGPIDLHHDDLRDGKVRKWLGDGGLDWIIVGGESGKGATPMHPAWVRSLREQAASAGRLDRFFFKQWGEYAPTPPPELATHGIFENGHHYRGGHLMGATDAPASVVKALAKETGRYTLITHCGKKRAGRVLDGIEHNGMPSTPHR